MDKNKDLEFCEDDRPFIITQTGKIVTAEELDQLADDFASGKYVPTVIRPRGRPLLGDSPSKIVQVRLDPEMADQLAKRAEHDHTTNSDILRKALEKYLAS